MRQDAVGCVVVEVPAGDEYTNDRRKSCADVWQAHTTTIWQPPPYPIPIGKTNAESSIFAHALLFSILLNGDIVIPGVTWRWSPASHPIHVVICTHIRSNIWGIKAFQIPQYQAPCSTNILQSPPLWYHRSKTVLLRFRASLLLLVLSLLVGEAFPGAAKCQILPLSSLDRFTHTLRTLRVCVPPYPLLSEHPDSSCRCAPGKSSQRSWGGSSQLVPVS